MTVGEMAGWHQHSMDISLSKFWQIVTDRGALCAVVHGVSKYFQGHEQVTEQSTHFTPVPRKRQFL